MFFLQNCLIYFKFNTQIYSYNWKKSFHFPFNDTDSLKYNEIFMHLGSALKYAFCSIWGTLLICIIQLSSLYCASTMRTLLLITKPQKEFHWTVISILLIFGYRIKLLSRVIYFLFVLTSTLKRGVSLFKGKIMTRSLKAIGIGRDKII